MLFRLLASTDPRYLLINPTESQGEETSDEPNRLGAQR
jgi:hypothetical protein